MHENPKSRIRTYVRITIYEHMYSRYIDIHSFCHISKFILNTTRKMSVNDYRTPPATELFTVNPGSDEMSATFVFGNENHTLGNSLRYILANQPRSDFVGYSVPHPYDPKMHIRLQCKGVPALTVLKKGLNDLEETANILDDVFLKAVQKFEGSS